MSAICSTRTSPLVPLSMSCCSEAPVSAVFVWRTSRPEVAMFV